MTLWHIAAFVILTLATKLGAERNCKQGFDTSSMLAVLAEFGLTNDAVSEPNDKDNTDAFPTISYAQDAFLPDEDNDQSASANIAALEVKSTERRSWTESFVGALADHPVLPTPTDNVTGSSLKVNAEAYLIVGTIEVIGVFLFTIVVCGCVCFCTIRHAQTQAHATAHNADIRERLRTKSMFQQRSSATSRASFDSGFSRSSLGSRSSWTWDLDLSGEEEDEDDEDLEEEEENEETEDPADKKENQKFEGGLVQSKVAKEISDNAIKEKGSQTIRFKD